MAVQTILFFTSFSDRSITLESTVYYFLKRGYKVLFLTTCPKGAIHKELEDKGITTYVLDVASSGRIAYYFKAIRYLVSFCRQHRVDFLHAHLQIPNLLSVLAARSLITKVLTVRHNSDVIYLNGTWKERFIEKIINRRSPCIIAISEKVRLQLIEKEGVEPEKVHRINNGYDFDQYLHLSKGPGEAEKIKSHYPCDLLLVSPGRLIRTKRHDLTIRAVRELQDKGFKIKLLILGDGPEAARLSALVKDLQLQETVFMVGYCENIADYIKAAGLVVLLSESEASNNSVKEAGYFERPVAVCRQVGDFDDYLEHKKNAFLLSKENAQQELVTVVEEVMKDNGLPAEMGRALRKKVTADFDIEAVGRQYEELQDKWTGAQTK